MSNPVHTIVVDTEGDERETLGIYLRTDEDTVLYNDWETGTLEYAPVDCVEITKGRRVGDELVEIPSTGS